MRTLPLFLLLACTPTTTVEDTDVDVDTDTDTDTEDIGDTGDTGNFEPNLAWDVTGDADGLAFSLVRVDPESFVMADIVAETEVSARIELQVDAPPTSDLLEHPDVPGLVVGYYMAGLHEDEDDGEWDPDERWFAASLSLTVYLDGILPPSYIESGLRVGWNAGVTSDGFELVDPLEQRIPVERRDTVTLGGSYDETIASTDRVSTISGAVFAGSPVDALDDDALTSGAWSLTVDGVPDADRFVDIDSNGSEEAVELSAAYTDLNRDGALTLGVDTVLGMGCSGSWLAVAWWLEPTTNLPDLMQLAGVGLVLGWNVPAFDPATGQTAFLTEAEALNLVLSTGCSLD
ncbi:MAG: hypothetical protein EXR71_02905 [Myxococcales bacterium]|nr:hypothetical protein [Myxococcales bacterium]